MDEALDVNRYWLERGRNYIQENLPRDFHRLQEQFLLDLLRASQMPLERILELGCGFGRITRVLAEAFPATRIAALDLSADQLARAGRYCDENPRISFQQYDFYSGAPFPGTDYDAVIAIEVFLHHPRPVIQGLLEKLSALARHLVNIDWSEEWPWQTPEHVWVHDYRALYAEAGLQCVTFPLPEKIDGLQQKLFIAARQLNPALLRLEAQVQAAQAEAGASAPAQVAAPGQALPEAARWSQQRELAFQEIRAAIPPGATFILVDDEQWGSLPPALRDYRVLPFLERNGLYWGPPPDDHTALRELERLRLAGASHLVVAWPSFWWLDHYPGLRHCLRSACQSLRENERLLIFRLPSDATLVAAAARAASS